MPEAFQVVIVGAGQAGLALGYYLKRQGAHFQIFDSGPQVGYSWRRRWDSLTLFSPARYDALPGLPFPARPDSFPGKDEVADYLARYAEVFDLPVRLNQEVVALERRGHDFLLETEDSTVLAKQVVVATGPFQRPYIPPFADRLDPHVTQLHSSEYRNTESLPPGDVLVVGTGNSGWQIAVDLAATRDVVLSGRELPRVPLRILGRSIFWWIRATGIMLVPANSALGRRMSSNDNILIGDRPPSLLGERLKRAPRAVDAQGDTVTFADGSRASFSNVVWATGYRNAYSWIRLPVFDDEGRPLHRRGVTSVPGLYFLGLRWQHTTGSALLGWVHRDARYLAKRIADRRSE
ncbi:MAG TPA: NAD(P)-binding domain-containing protein [Trueperaceae bacterium]